MEVTRISGLYKVRRERPDVIVLDTMHPKMVGFKVCRILKFDDSFALIPVVMLTAG